MTPEPTETWTPIPHTELIELVLGQLGSFGLQVVQEQHGLWVDGNRYFGLFDLRNGDNPTDYGLTIGLRNAHDRSFSAGLAVGGRVFVCDNLSFSGEITIARKHTSRIRQDLPNITARAVGRLTDLRDVQDRRIAAYKDLAIEDGRALELITRLSVDAHALPTRLIPDVVKEWRTPRHTEFAPRTAWSLFNAFTETYKATSFLELPRRTQALHGLLDVAAGLATNDKASDVKGDAEDAEVRIA